MTPTVIAIITALSLAVVTLTVALIVTRARLRTATNLLRAAMRLLHDADRIVDMGNKECAALRAELSKRQPFQQHVGEA